jgi:hypothetical protein
VMYCLATAAGSAVMGEALRECGNWKRVMTLERSGQV